MLACQRFDINSKIAPVFEANGIFFGRCILKSRLALAVVAMARFLGIFLPHLCQLQENGFDKGRLIAPGFVFLGCRG